MSEHRCGNCECWAHGWCHRHLHPTWFVTTCSDWRARGEEEQTVGADASGARNPQANTPALGATQREKVDPATSTTPAVCSSPPACCPPPPRAEVVPDHLIEAAQNEPWARALNHDLASDLLATRRERDEAVELLRRAESCIRSIVENLSLPTFIVERHDPSGLDIRISALLRRIGGGK